MPSLLNPESVPKGTIAIWTGSLATIPQGWQLADGTNGTPDLRSQFPKCVPDGVTDPGTTGGEERVTLIISEIPAHFHTLTIGNHEHDSAQVDAPTGSPTTLPLLGSTFTGEFLAPISSTALVGGVSTAGSGVSHENLPSCQDVLYIQRI